MFTVEDVLVAARLSISFMNIAMAQYSKAFKTRLASNYCRDNLNILFTTCFITNLIKQLGPKRLKLIKPLLVPIHASQRVDNYILHISLYVRMYMQPSVSVTVTSVCYTQASCPPARRQADLAGVLGRKLQKESSGNSHNHTYCTCAVIYVMCSVLVIYLCNTSYTTRMSGWTNQLYSIHKCLSITILRIGIYKHSLM